MPGIQELLVILLIVISLGFLAMIRPFLRTILMAAIFAGLLQPVHNRILRLVRGNGIIAASLTLVLFLAIVVSECVIEKIKVLVC